MSAKLAMRVLESALPRRLKPAAVVMALFADEHGERCYPSVGRVMFLLGFDEGSRRAVERHLSALRSMGVLEPQCALEGGRLPGGRGRSVLYRFNADALPVRDPYKPRTHNRGLEIENPGIAAGVSAADTPDGQMETPDGQTETPDGQTRNPRCTAGRSSSHLLERTRERSSRRPGAVAPSSRTEDTHQDQDPEPESSEAYDAIAEQAIRNSEVDDHRRDVANMEAQFKRLCAERGRPYDRDRAKKALEAKLAARAAAEQHFHQQFAAMAGPRRL